MKSLAQWNSIALPSACHTDLIIHKNGMLNIQLRLLPLYTLNDLITQTHNFTAFWRMLLFLIASYGNLNSVDTFAFLLRLLVKKNIYIYLGKPSILVNHVKRSLTPLDTWSCPIWDLHLFYC